MQADKPECPSVPGWIAAPQSREHRTKQRGQDSFHSIHVATLVVLAMRIWPLSSKISIELEDC